MLTAALWAALAQSALIVGALLVARFRKLSEPRWLGLIMAFGAGTVISAVTTDLVAEAYKEAGRRPTGIGLAVGAGVFWVVTWWLESRGESERPEQLIENAADVSLETEPAAATATEARNLTIGMVIDGIPESIAIGLTLFSAAGVSIALVGAVFLAGLPTAIGVAASLLAAGTALSKILARFAGIVVAGALFGALGFAALSSAPLSTIAFIQSVAAGAMIVAVVNEMIPIAVRGAGRYAGLAAAAGFALAAFLSTSG
jgi:ZIP family zinc transporter